MSGINEKFKTALKEWNSLNDDIEEMQNIMKNKMKPYQNKIQLLKDKSQKLETTLVNYMEHNGLNNKKITIDDKTVECQTSKKSAPLSKDYIHKKLEEILNDREKAVRTVDYIYDNREVTNKLILKRKNVKKIVTKKI
jgi:hypothetical protein